MPSSHRPARGGQVSAVEFEVCPKCSELVGPDAPHRHGLPSCTACAHYPALTPIPARGDPIWKLLPDAVVVIDDPHALPGPNSDEARRRVERWYHETMMKP